MSQFTRCPFCETTFKVVVDQLRVSQGWVRCGHCKRLFDASRHLHGTQPKQGSLLPPLLDRAESSAPVPPPAPTPVSASKASPPPPPLDVPGTPVRPIETPKAAEAPDAFAPSENPSEQHPTVLRKRRHRSSSRLSASDTTGQETTTAARKTKRKSSSHPPAPPADDFLLEIDSDELGFVRAARRNAFWQQPLVRASVALGGILLAGLLLLQVALQERDTLAARYPALEPWLLRLCATAGCRVQAPRQIDAVVIDSSSFLKARGDASTYQLQVRLKNTLATPIAMPALELTLTDAQDQATLRRVLQPEDMAAPEQLDGNGSWTVTLALRVTAPTLQVAGYRILAFYP